MWCLDFQVFFLTDKSPILVVLTEQKRISSQNWLLIVKLKTPRSCLMFKGQYWGVMVVLLFPKRDAMIRESSGQKNEKMSPLLHCLLKSSNPTSLFVYQTTRTLKMSKAGKTIVSSSGWLQKFKSIVCKLMPSIFSFVFSIFEHGLKY